MPMTQSGAPLKDLPLRILQGVSLRMKGIHAAKRYPMKILQAATPCPMKGLHAVA